MEPPTGSSVAHPKKVQTELQKPGERERISVVAINGGGGRRVLTNVSLQSIGKDGEGEVLHVVKRVSRKPGVEEANELREGHDHLLGPRHHVLQRRVALVQPRPQAGVFGAIEVRMGGHAGRHICILDRLQQVPERWELCYELYYELYSELYSELYYELYYESYY